MRKKTLSLALALAMCLGLTVPAFATDWQEATPEEISGTFTVLRNGTVDEKTRTGLTEKTAYITNWFEGDGAEIDKTEINYAVVAPTDSWTIGNTGSEAITASGDATYCVNIWLGAYWPSDTIEKVDGEPVYQGGFADWWGDQGHFVDGALESDEHGCNAVLVKPGETITIPFSAFAQTTELNPDFDSSDFIYELNVRSLYKGNSENEDFFEGVVEQVFYFKMDPNAETTKPAEPETTEPEQPTEPETTEPADPAAPAYQVSDWAKDRVALAVETGLAPEGLGGDYRVEITRAQFAAAAVKLYEAMSGEKAPAVAESPFTDTEDPVILQAEALGFVSGMGEGKFEPDALVNREQAAVMLSSVYAKLGGEIPAVEATSFADDGDISGWARSAVAFMNGKGIVTGIGDNSFGPKSGASIEQALLISLKMFETLK